MLWQGVGADLGFFSTKFTSGADSFASFDSVVGYGARSMMDESNDHLLFADGATVGQAAIRFATDLRRLKDDNWIQSPEISRLFRAGVASLAGIDSTKLFCVTALPINLFKFSRGKLANHLDGTHEFSMACGRDVNFTARIKEIPQAFACLCDQFLTAHGLIYNKIALEKVGVIDIGGRDVNILVSDGFRTADALSDTYHDGVWTLVERLRGVLAADFDRPSLTEYETERALRSGVLAHQGDAVDISVAIDRMSTEYVAKIMARVRSLWGDELNSMKRIFLTGGGALLFGEKLLHELPRQTEIVADAIQSNANGACKYAKFLLARGVATA